VIGQALRRLRLITAPVAVEEPADHLSSHLDEEGRIGVTAIGHSPDQAHGLSRDVAKVLDGLAAEGEATTSHR
jgi:hypothetical protein